MPVSQFSITDPQPNYGPPPDIDTAASRDDVVTINDAVQAMVQALDRRGAHSASRYGLGSVLGTPLVTTQPDHSHAGIPTSEL